MQVHGILSRTYASVEGTYQAALRRDPSQYAVHRMFYPVLGIVTAVHRVDSPYNSLKPTRKEATPRDDLVIEQKFVADDVGAMRYDDVASRIECEVYVLYAGDSTHLTLSRVPICQRGGVDDVEVWEPKPCSQPERIKRGEVDPTRMDGDWVVVSFIGGSITRPIITAGYPHPANFYDAPREGDAGLWRIRRNGVSIEVDSLGNIAIDALLGGGKTKLDPTFGTAEYQLNDTERGGGVLLRAKTDMLVSALRNATLEAANLLTIECDEMTVHVRSDRQEITDGEHSVEAERLTFLAQNETAFNSPSITLGSDQVQIGTSVDDGTKTPQELAENTIEPTATRGFVEETFDAHTHDISGEYDVELVGQIEAIGSLGVETLIFGSGFGQPLRLRITAKRAPFGGPVETTAPMSEFQGGGPADHPFTRVLRTR